MLLITVLCFCFSALLGLYLASYLWQNKNTPKGIAFLHGGLASFALVLLILFSLLSPHSFLIPIILFVLTACGGVILIIRDLFGKTIPKFLFLGHGIFAIISLTTLLFYFFS